MPGSYLVAGARTPIGKLSGTLPPDTKPLTLYVEDLGLPPGADRRGVVTLTVDGSRIWNSSVGLAPLLLGSR